jgi:hypothetical protein
MMAVIAELMIAANASVATKAREAFPTSAFVRRHAPPRLGGFEELRALVASEGVDVALDASNGEALAGSIERAARCAACPADAGVLFRSIATRAMSEAQYACAGATPPADGGGWGYVIAPVPARPRSVRAVHAVCFLSMILFFSPSRLVVALRPLLSTSCHV